MRESVDLEGTLDRVIGRLSRPGAPREAKALLVDARRLLAVVRNWRTIAPTDAARDQMSERIESLLEIASAIAPEPPPPEPPPPEPARRAAAPRAPREVHEEVRPGAISDPFLRRNAARLRDEPPPSLTLEPPVVPARSAPPLAGEPARSASGSSSPRAAARDVQPSNGAPPVDPPRTPADPPKHPMDPTRGRTLPDLDISGVAELFEEPPGFLRDETLEARRPPAGRSPRADIEALRGRPDREPAPRVHPSSTPPQGRRRADAPGADDRTGSPEWTGRTTRHSQLIDDPETNDGVIYSGGDEPGRPTPRPVGRASPPPGARDKTSIAVRPLPAPEVLDKRLIMLNDPYSKRAEAYRTLRRKLAGPGAPRTIAVTSAQAGEGKTTCAVNLALAFRETSNEKVLLIEANLRSPSLAALFGFEPPVCFARQMAKHRDSTRASWTVAEQFEPLHVLAVDPASKTSPLLDAVAFANALEQLVDAGYDHIIVDTPPALGGSDVNLVADAVDGVVVVAWVKKSKKSLVKQAIEQLKPATILGVVTLEG